METKQHLIRNRLDNLNENFNRTIDKVVEICFISEAWTVYCILKNSEPCGLIFVVNPSQMIWFSVLFLGIAMKYVQLSLLHYVDFWNEAQSLIWSFCYTTLHCQLIHECFYASKFKYPPIPQNVGTEVLALLNTPNQCWTVFCYLISSVKKPKWLISYHLPVLTFFSLVFDH